MEKFLARQSFKIVVIEQEAATPFNRGKLANCGFRLCADESTTIIVHDVDSLPRGANYYSKVTRPTHLAGRVGKFGYQVPYPDFFGCVVALPCADFTEVNGFSNEYWGWGREDFELSVRIRNAGLTVDYLSGEYDSLPHEQSTWGPLVLGRWRAFESGQYQWQQDGLNTLNFKLLTQQPLRDFLNLDVGPQHTLYKVDLLFEQSIVYKQRSEGTLPVLSCEEPRLHCEKPEPRPGFEIPSYRFD